MDKLYSSLPLNFNKKADLVSLEVDLVAEAIYWRYGHDFRNFARASLTRRLQKVRVQFGLKEVSDLIPLFLNDKDFMTKALVTLSIPVTEMFRDPQHFAILRSKVFPFLQTFPFMKVWHAGCSTGEEAYSLAIMLKEAGLYDRTTIYATDFNDISLEKAKQGIYSVDQIKQYTENYQKSGGLRSFSDYYHAKYVSAVLDASLRERILFANHNLATDSVFGEMNLILCRNVMIYFDKKLQERVLGLFRDSLAIGGYLCLGSREAMSSDEVGRSFKVIDRDARLFQKCAEGVNR